LHQPTARCEPAREPRGGRGDTEKRGVGVKPPFVFRIVPRPRGCPKCRRYTWARL